MKYNLSNHIESSIAQNQFNHLVINERLIELKEIKKTRSNLQNAALHLFFDIISNELNRMGLEFEYRGIKHYTKIESQQIKESYYYTRYTPEIVKYFIWVPIQITLFKIESTTELTTQQINEISDVLIKFFGEKGIRILFPDIKTKLDKNGSTKKD
jgi:F0F1-type ATP synthase delta subunit